MLRRRHPLKRSSFQRSSSRWHPPSLSELRTRVLSRDGWECLAKRKDPEHVCAGTFGPTKDPRDALTLEHVRLEPGGARRDDVRFCVTLCHKANIEHWGSTTANRAWLNAQLDAMYPDRRQDLRSLG